MSLRADLYQWLKAQPDVRTLVAARIYPVLADPGDTFPKLVISKVSNDSIESHDGPSGLDGMHVQLSCFDRTPEGVDALRDVLKNLLQPFKGVLTPGTTVVGAVHYVTEHDLYESETRVFSTVLEFLIWHTP